MKTLDVCISPSEKSARNEWLDKKIREVLLSSMLGFELVPRFVTKPEENILQFRFDDTTPAVGKVCVDFFGDGKLSINRQPVLLDLAIAGEKFPENIKKKVETLDTDESFTWAVLVQDGAESPVGPERTITESILAEKPWILDQVSHLLTASANGDQLALLKLAATRGCVLFSAGVQRLWLDTGFTISCNGVDDFLNKAESITGKSKDFFMKMVAPKVFTADNISALSARQTIASALRIGSLPDYGLKEFESRATQRLLDMNQRAS